MVFTLADVSQEVSVVLWSLEVLCNISRFVVFLSCCLMLKLQKHIIMSNIDSLGIIFPDFCIGYLLGLYQLGNSNEYPQLTFLWLDMESYP